MAARQVVAAKKGPANAHPPPVRYAIKASELQEENGAEDPP